MLCRSSQSSPSIVEWPLDDTAMTRAEPAAAGPADLEQRISSRVPQEGSEVVGGGSRLGAFRRIRLAVPHATSVVDEDV